MLGNYHLDVSHFGIYYPGVGGPVRSDEVILLGSCTVTA